MYLSIYNGTERETKTFFRAIIKKNVEIQFNSTIFTIATIETKQKQKIANRIKSLRSNYQYNLIKELPIWGNSWCLFPNVRTLLCSSLAI